MKSYDPPTPCHRLNERHQPIVRRVADMHHITCERCGMMMDFRPLEMLGVNVSDWEVPVYESP